MRFRAVGDELHMLCNSISTILNTIEEIIQTEKKVIVNVTLN